MPRRNPSPLPCDLVPGFAQARLNLALLHFKAKRLPAEPGILSPGAARRAGTCRGVERGGAGPHRIAAVRRSPQRLCARGAEQARVRGSALQPELRPVQPRRFRRGAPRDEARHRARSVLRAAKVRAGDRLPVRASRAFDRAGPGRRGACRRARDRRFRVRRNAARLAVHVVDPGDRSRGRPTAAVPIPTGWPSTICRRDCTTGRQRRSVARCCAAPIGRPA